MDHQIGEDGATSGSSLEEETRAEGAKLIRSAFDAARASGRLDWWRMSVAVLKNRLLDATERTFDEERWGAATFSEFVGLYPDVIAVDDSTRPATVELVDHADPSTAPALRLGDRIRRDLWHAVLDHTSGDLHLWRDGRAVAVPPDEAGGAQNDPRLPTIDQDTLDAWRKSFVESVSPLPKPLDEATQRWQAERLHDNLLPGQLRGRWNGRLKQLVLERLDAWFEEAGIPWPPDVVEPRAAPARRRDGSTESLRSLIVEAVGAMTREELEEIRLPPAALLRTRK